MMTTPRIRKGYVRPSLGSVLSGSVAQPDIIQGPTQKFITTQELGIVSYVPKYTNQTEIGPSTFQVDTLDRMFAPLGGKYMSDTFETRLGRNIASFATGLLTIGDQNMQMMFKGSGGTYGFYFNTGRFAISDCDLGWKFLTTSSSSGEAWNVENASNELVARFRTFAGTGSDNFVGLKLDYGMEYQQEKIRLTPEGGYAVRLTNRTGGASVKGSVVQSSSAYDNAFMLSASNSDYPFGVVYESGIADGSECWMVQFGRAQVLMKDSTVVARDASEYLYASSTVGRASVGTSTAVATHNREIGHPLEANAGGTDQLIWALLHYN
jgi:hypothetical protein